MQHLRRTTWSTQRTGAWDDALELGQKFGYRNAQATVLAPTGTIAFMMDCDTTGVEPDIALVKYKKLVGGGMMKIVNQTVPRALRRLGYAPAEIEAIVRHIDDTGTIEGAPDAARRTPRGLRLRVQAGERPAVDPPHGPHQDDGGRAAVYLGRHLEDGESPNEATIEDVASTYVEAWRHGVKAIAIYRDGSRRCSRSRPRRARERPPRRPLWSSGRSAAR